ncbi:hypothetical protein [Marinicrinis lubricantis]|uniref:Transcription elongation factor GreA/GreB C-terminal domain-containing protein n=1 Tax=Marinicrinis lubricantis TaxID=2086470 RepID=A0ABW1IPV6_9BACL
METKVERYFLLKQQQKELEQELSQLRAEIVERCIAESSSELKVGSYQVKIVHQKRKEFDEQKLFEALPDLEVWKLLSKPDASKIAGLVKLKVIPEEKLKDTYQVKNVTLLQVEKI